MSQNVCVCVTERSIASSLLGCLESHFALLWYKILHNEVAWTEENAGKPELTLFSAWLITLHRILRFQNTIKIRINKQAKQGQSFQLVCISLEWVKAFLTKLSHDQSHTAERDLWLTAFEYSNDDGKTF